MSGIDLSVIIPVFDEKARIGPTLDAVLTYLSQRSGPWELIVVDDGSRDGTADIVAIHIRDYSNARLISYTPNRGKGAAIRTGVLASRGSMVLFCDADLSTPIQELERLVPLLEMGNEIVIGSRATEEASSTAPTWRRLGGLAFRTCRNAVIGLRELADSQCGFKLFLGDVARQLFAIQQIDRFMFDIEVLYLAQRLGYGIGEVPVRWTHTSGSKVRFADFSINWVRDLIRILWIHRRSLRRRTGKRDGVSRSRINTRSTAATKRG
jgi:dolichyl-phosphate beta-glucosyltransferase